MSAVVDPRGVLDERDVQADCSTDRRAAAAAATAALTISYFLFKPAIVPKLFIIYLHF